MNTSDSRRDLTQYKYYEQRLKTYEDWPKQMIPDKYSLAKSGFIYTGQGDKLRCFQCGVGVNQWERTDDAWKEHHKWSPNCDYLKMVGCNVNDTDTPNRGFGQYKPSPGTFGLPKPKTPTDMNTETRTFAFATDSHLF